MFRYVCDIFRHVCDIRKWVEYDIIYLSTLFALHYLSILIIFFSVYNYQYRSDVHTYMYTLLHVYITSYMYTSPRHPCIHALIYAMFIYSSVDDLYKLKPPINVHHSLIFNLPSMIDVVCISTLINRPMLFSKPFILIAFIQTPARHCSRADRYN